MTAKLSKIEIEARDIIREANKILNKQSKWVKNVFVKAKDDNFLPLIIAKAEALLEQGKDHQDLAQIIDIIDLDREWIGLEDIDCLIDDPKCLSGVCFSASLAVAKNYRKKNNRALIKAHKICSKAIEEYTKNNSKYGKDWFETNCDICLANYNSICDNNWLTNVITFNESEKTTFKDIKAVLKLALK